jgi:hypothetical protein
VQRDCAREIAVCERHRRAGHTATGTRKAQHERHETKLERREQRADAEHGGDRHDTGALDRAARR